MGPKVYKVKVKPNGEVDRYKARLVAKGYSQVEGLDFKKRFSLVAKIVTVEIFISLATSKYWPIFQFDINNTFLHVFLEQEIYMQPAAGYSEAAQRHICLLKKSVYGLMQASRHWNLKFTYFLQSLGFVQSIHDQSLFTRNMNNDFCAILIYVDELFLLAPQCLL